MPTFDELPEKRKKIVRTYHKLRKEQGEKPSDANVAKEAYPTCHEAYVWQVRNDHLPEMFGEVPPIAVQRDLYEPPEEGSVDEILANSVASTHYYDEEQADVLYEAYVMLIDRGYSPGNLAGLREIILTETELGEEFLRQ